MRDGDWRALDALDVADQLALEYAERMTATPPLIDSTFMARMTAHFDNPIIVQMAAIVAWENYRARMNVGLGVEGHSFYQPGGSTD